MFPLEFFTHPPAAGFTTNTIVNCLPTASSPAMPGALPKNALFCNDAPSALVYPSPGASHESDCKVLQDSCPGKLIAAKNRLQSCAGKVDSRTGHFSRDLLPFPHGMDC